MAIGATIYKAKINICDLRRHYYAEHNLTVACHPSETEQRMMLRILCFALYADDNLMFGKGVSSPDEPDLWQHNDNGTIDTWIDLGQPDMKQVKKACSKATKVIIFSYGDSALENWWSQSQRQATDFEKLNVFHINTQIFNRLKDFADEKNLSFTVNIDEDEIFLSNDSDSFNFQVTQLK
jgi:uncharacterized protein YaeQ